VLGRSSFGGIVLSAANACVVRLGCGIDGPVNVEVGSADNSDAVDVDAVGCETSRHAGTGASPTVAVASAPSRELVSGTT